MPFLKKPVSALNISSQQLHLSVVMMGTMEAKPNYRQSLRAVVCLSWLFEKENPKVSQWIVNTGLTTPTRFLWMTCVCVRVWVCVNVPFAFEWILKEEVERCLTSDLSSLSGIVYFIYVVCLGALLHTTLAFCSFFSFSVASDTHKHTHAHKKRKPQ